MSKDKTTIFRRSPLERLSSPEELDQLMQVARPRSWLVLAALFALLLAALLWSVFAFIPTTVAGRGVLAQDTTNPATLQAVAFTSLDASRSIQPGMAAKIALNSVKKDQSGMLLGRVTLVDALPSEQQAIAQAVGNSAVAQALVAAGNIVRVVVDLVPDQNSASGFSWTSENGPAVQLQKGMFCDATITTSEQHPINLIIP